MATDRATIIHATTTTTNNHATTTKTQSGEEAAVQEANDPTIQCQDITAVEITTIATAQACPTIAAIIT